MVVFECKEHYFYNVYRECPERACFNAGSMPVGWRRRCIDKIDILTSTFALFHFLLAICFMITIIQYTAPLDPSVCTAILHYNGVSNSPVGFKLQLHSSPLCGTDHCTWCHSLGLIAAHQSSRWCHWTYFYSYLHVYFLAFIILEHHDKTWNVLDPLASIDLKPHTMLKVKATLLLLSAYGSLAIASHCYPWGFFSGPSIWLPATCDLSKLYGAPCTLIFKNKTGSSV